MGMIVEQRTYAIVPGKLGAYLALYEAEGLEVQAGHLGRLLGYYTSDIGPLNQVVHLWAYEDLNDRARRRESLFKDQAWLAYLDKIMPLILRQDSVVLTPAPFARPREAERVRPAERR